MTLRPTPGTRWDPVGLALQGALVGGAAVIAHEVHAILAGDIGSADPFVHVLSEFAGASLGGAALFAGAALIRNRLLD